MDLNIMIKEFVLANPFSPHYTHQVQDKKILISSKNIPLPIEKHFNLQVTFP